MHFTNTVTSLDGAFARLARLPLLGLLSLTLLGGCNYFDFGDDETEQPAELVDFEEEVELRRLWRVNVGDGQGDKYNRLTPAIDGQTLYAASSNGEVVAVNRDDGERIWRTRLNDVRLAGGVGIGGNLVLLGTEDARVIALARDSGEQLWETMVSSEVLSIPATNGRIAVVQTVDGNVIGLDADSGEQIWIYESTVPALSLRGTSSPVILEDFVIAGFGNGTVVSVALDNGTLRWEERVAIPTGRSEIDRLVDIDGELFLNNNRLLVASYQGFLASIDPVTGQTRWRVPESSPLTLSSGFGNIYITGERSHVKAYRQGQNEPRWVNDQLDLRQVSPPTAFGNYVAVGDFDGYVHLLSQVDGHLVGRTRVDRDGVRAQILAQNDILYVFANDGTLTALRVQ